MRSPMLRRTMRLAALCVVLPALTPTLAGATTFTVDDDRTDCPSASFSSIQAAVDQAAPFDTIKVCPGLYEERSVPTGSASNPVQPGAVNGLTITKQVTIVGAGADEVTIRPAPSLGTSLAGTAPFLRDGGGNVITVSRQTLGSTDDNEQFVDISGVTVESPDIYAEAGIAFFNASGAVRNSIVGPLLRSGSTTAETTLRPHGWGIVMTNSLQGAGQGTTRREVRVEDSEVLGFQAGGVLFDDARGPDGDAANTVRAGIRMYGYVRRSSILAGSGAPAAAALPQYGIRYHAGARGAIEDSEVIGRATGGTRPTSAVLLSDAETGPDPSNPAVRGFSMTGSSLIDSTNGLLNRNITNTANTTGPDASAPGNWWGCDAGPRPAQTSSTTTGCQGTSGTAGVANVAFTPFLTALPARPVTPGPTLDAPPTARISDPLDGTTVKVGDQLAPVVAAGDDIGVKSVSLSAAGVVVGTVAKAPYVFAYTPGTEVAGKDVPLVATVTDSAGQSTTSTVTLKVAALPAPAAAAPAPAPAAVPAPVVTATPVVASRPQPRRARVLPRRVSATVTPAKDVRGARVFTTRGKLTTASSVGQVAGCKGRVTIRIKAGTRTISLRRVSVRRDCSFRSKVTFTQPRRFARKSRLSVKVRFEGNTALLPRSAATRTVRVK